MGSSRALPLMMLALLFAGCGAQYPDISRESMIPADIHKVAPSDDPSPPILHSNGWEEPVPLPVPVSTAGAEDSAFITPDGDTLYLFFTPDVRVPVEKQVLDNVTGVYVSHRSGGSWSKPKRVWLQNPGKLALDGCEFVQDDIIWFCSAREGYTSVNLFKAQYKGGNWTGWTYAGDEFPQGAEVGELHFSSDWSELYYHSPRAGGKGKYDIWLLRKVDGTWQQPENVAAVNTAESDGWPFLSYDGQELWFTRTYKGSPAIYRSMRANCSWSEPELIISQFAGEPSLDENGNIYFTHHFYRNGTMVEADIYMAKKK